MLRTLPPRLDPPGTHDACYLPRSCHVTGDIGVHELAWAGDELWLANTRFSCLCTLDSDHSFVPRWRPPFITALAAEDRCHLNGIAVENGRVRYVTALGETDTADGWREHKPHGGVLIDVPSGEVLLRGLSMPHSPRIYGEQVWLLESGTGRLLRGDVAAGRSETVAEFPGFARGLAILRRPCVRWPVKDPHAVGDGRRAAGRAAQRTDLRNRRRRFEIRYQGRDARVSDRSGRGVRRAVPSAPAFSRSDRLPTGDGPALVRRPRAKGPCRSGTSSRSITAASVRTPLVGWEDRRRAGATCTTESTTVLVHGVAEESGRRQSLARPHLCGIPPPTRPRPCERHSLAACGRFCREMAVKIPCQSSEPRVGGSNPSECILSSVSNGPPAQL